jgi:hypothetical protein
MLYFQMKNPATVGGTGFDPDQVSNHQPGLYRAWDHIRAAWSKGGLFYLASILSHQANICSN